MLTSSRAWLAVLLGLSMVRAAAQTPATVRIGVLSLFHPRLLVLSADHPLEVTLDASVRMVPANQSIALRAGSSGMVVEGLAVQAASVLDLHTDATEFTLSVPGKLSRRYVGALTVTTVRGALSPVITLPTEDAVASIVAAEAPPGAPPEALKAQAVASRSFLLSGMRAHRGFDACDTTHCQFLRSPPPAESAARSAAAATLGLVLTWRGSPGATPRIVPAMYSRSCGGSTHPLIASTAALYPFYAVRCAYCLRHPERWTRALSGPAPRTERERILYNRVHGWSALPSIALVECEGEIEGRGTGHGIGMCQLGMSDLARRGKMFTEILGYYYPNTTIARLP